MGKFFNAFGNFVFRGRTMNIALILAGGTGNRVGGDVPKQYLLVRGRMVISYCFQVLADHAAIDAIQIVAEKSWWGEIEKEFMRLHLPMEKLRGFSVPGKSRQRSILHGLKDIRVCAPDDSLVLVHDAVRPMLPPDLVQQCLTASNRSEGAIPCVPVRDAMYETSEDGKQIVRPLDRQRILAGQTPEAFLLGKYYAANMQLLPHKIDFVCGSTEPALLADMDITMIPGDERNFKITTVQDVRRFCQLVETAPCAKNPKAKDTEI